MTVFRSIRAATRLARLAFAIGRARFESGHLSSPVSRAHWQQRQARRMLKALDIEVFVNAALPPHGLIVCNHLSYLDVLVIAAQGQAVFVAKSDVRHWPFIGPLLKSAGTILATRERPSSAGKTAAEIRNALNEPLPVVLFPEGTSSDGECVLPFKPSLLQPAFDTRLPIFPAAISYQASGGDPATEVCYWGDATFFPHLIRLASLEKVTATLHLGEEISLPQERKAAAKILHAEISRLLAALR